MHDKTRGSNTGPVVTLREVATFWEGGCGRGPDLQAEALRGEGSLAKLSRMRAGVGG